MKVHDTRNPPPVWEVMSIYSGVGSIAHAGLMNPADPLERKTVSFPALLDNTHYRLLRDVGADPVEQDTCNKRARDLMVDDCVVFDLT